MDTHLSVGAKIKEARKRRHLTQEQLAERIERSVDAISNIERGISLPGFQTLIRLNEVLGLDLDLRHDRDGRDALELELLQLCRSLDESHLRLAIEQIRALTTWAQVEK